MSAAAQLPEEPFLVGLVILGSRLCQVQELFPAKGIVGVRRRSPEPRHGAEPLGVLARQPRPADELRLRRNVYRGVTDNGCLTRQQVPAVDLLARELGGGMSRNLAFPQDESAFPAHPIAAADAV